MTLLQDKYRSQRITTDELSKLREEINAATDEVLEASMRKEWNDIDDETDRYHAETENIWQRIEKQINPARKSPWSIAWKWTQIAAVIMFPILLFVAYQLYDENASLTGKTTTFSTHQGEKANIVLPDGTCILLNENTVLSYNTDHFQGRRREIAFEGEASFQVAKDAHRPFVVKSQGLSGQVWGTTFNLLARKDDDIAKLALLSGKVDLASPVSHQSKRITPKQIAVLDKSTGHISVYNAEDEMQEVTAWQRNEIVFRDASLIKVISTIEKNYGVKFVFKTTPNMADVFTGTMLSNDLNENLRILEQSYHVKSTLCNKTITITSQSLD
mgnify:FL=1